MNKKIVIKIGSSLVASESNVVEVNFIRKISFQIKELINLGNEIRNNLMKSKMLIQVHDELIFEVGPGELMELSMMINEIMPNAIKLDVPVLVDIKTGDSWGKLE